MKIICTGGLGHIGSRLIRSLPFQFPDSEIIIIDNLYSQAYYSLFELSRLKNYKFIHADIVDADLYKLFSNSDVVIHLAAITDAEHSHEQKDIVHRVNFEGTKNVAETCLEAGCPMIFASTTSVYGVQEDEVDETCSTLKPQSPYADSKIESEQFLKELGVKFIICRLGTIFGTSPGMRFHTAVNKFCFQSAIGQPITVWRTALNQNRPYLDLSDLIRALGFIIDRKLYNNEIYNLLTTNTTVANIIDIIKLTIPTVSIQYVDTRIMSQLSYTISNKKFVNLGFKFEGNIATGIGDTLRLLSGIKS